MNAPTTTTTATSAAITPTLTPRLPVATARWLPVHSPPSHSPLCCGPDDAAGGAPPWVAAARNPGRPRNSRCGGSPARRDRFRRIQVRRNRFRRSQVRRSRIRRSRTRRSRRPRDSRWRGRRVHGSPGGRTRVRDTRGRDSPARRSPARRSGSSGAGRPKRWVGGSSGTPSPGESSGSGMLCLPTSALVLASSTGHRRIRHRCRLPYIRVRRRCRIGSV